MPVVAHHHVGSSRTSATNKGRWIRETGSDSPLWHSRRLGCRHFPQEKSADATLPACKRGYCTCTVAVLLTNPVINIGRAVTVRSRRLDAGTVVEPAPTVTICTCPLRTARLVVSVTL